MSHQRKKKSAPCNSFHFTPYHRIAQHSLSAHPARPPQCHSSPWHSNQSSHFIRFAAYFSFIDLRTYPMQLYPPVIPPPGQGTSRRPSNAARARNRNRLFCPATGNEMHPGPLQEHLQEHLRLPKIAKDRPQTSLHCLKTAPRPGKTTPRPLQNRPRPPRRLFELIFFEDIDFAIVLFGGWGWR